MIRPSTNHNAVKTLFGQDANITADNGKEFAGHEKLNQCHRKTFHYKHPIWSFLLILCQRSHDNWDCTSELNPPTASRHKIKDM
ncbi:MAG: hypothetical protein ABL924_17915 [Methyloglobulus sp.]